MDDIVMLLQSILAELTEMNGKLDEIQGIGACTNIADVGDKLDEIKSSVDEITANGIYSLQDVSNKLDGLDTLDDIKSSVDDITANGMYNLQDIRNKLDTLDITISTIDI